MGQFKLSPSTCETDRTPFPATQTVKRVRKTALSIARSLNPLPDLLVVELAALMHDLADKKYLKLPEGTTLYDHFLPFFQGFRGGTGSDLDIIVDGRLHDIVKIVENVSWTTEKKLRAEGGITSWYGGCKELHCVQDADRLDAIGAFGKQTEWRNILGASD